jgi:hypothetical protein
VYQAVDTEPVHLQTADEPRGVISRVEATGVDQTLHQANRESGVI